MRLGEGLKKRRRKSNPTSGKGDQRRILTVDSDADEGLVEGHPLARDPEWIDLMTPNVAEHFDHVVDEGICRRLRIFQQVVICCFRRR